MPVTIFIHSQYWLNLCQDYIGYRDYPGNTWLEAGIYSGWDTIHYRAPCTHTYSQLEAIYIC